MKRIITIVPATMIGLAALTVPPLVQRDFPVFGKAGTVDSKLMTRPTEPAPYQDPNQKMKKHSNVTQKLVTHKICHGGSTIEHQKYVDSDIQITAYRGKINNLHLINCSLVKDPYLERSELEKSEITSSTFKDCEFKDTYMDKQGFSHCVFDGSVFDGVTSCRFGDEGSNVVNSSFRKTNWTGTTFNREPHLSGFLGLDGRFDKCDFTDAKFKDTKFDKVTFRDTSFDGARFRGTVVGGLVRCSFTGADVKGLKVTGGMSPWTYITLWWKGADLSEAFSS